MNGTVHEIFRRTSAHHRDAVAVTGSSARWTYGELDDLSQRIAGGLARAGVGPGSHVPVFVPRSEWFIAAALGVLKRGAAYVPIDLTYPAERQQAMLHDLGAAVGIGEEGEAGRVGVRVLGVGDLAKSAPSPDVATAPDAPAYVMFTSGSVGRPKGTVIPHRGIVRLVCNADYADFGPAHTWAVMSSVSFDASTLEIWGALLNGGRCAVVEDALVSVDGLAAAFAQRRVTDTWLTAALFNTLVDYRVEMFRPLLQVFTGGEAESPKHFRRFLEACPGVRLIHGYGPTENTTFSLCHTVSAADAATGERIPIGRPIRGTAALILNEDGRECGEGEVGELCVGGEGVALGYLKQEELTRAAFVTLEGRMGAWYRTGDMVKRRADGAVVFVGRRDRQVKIRGYRIELEEVERTLAGCPIVTGACVDVAGATPEEKKLVAYCAVGAQTGKERARALIAEWAGERLPSYLAPGDIRVVRELPRTANGKVDRARLERETRPGGGSAPRKDPSGDLQGEAGEMAAIWRELLPGVPIDARTDFFAAGGHSVLVLKMLAEIQRRLGKRVRPSVVYRARTLGRLSRAVRESGAAGPENPVLPEEDAPDYPCGRAQSGLLYEWWRDPASTAYHVFAAFVVEAGFDETAFRGALDRSLAAHDSLRAVFSMGEQGPRQRFRERLSAEEVIRAEGAIAWNGRGAIPGEVLARIREPFDVTTGPLIRVHMFGMGEGRRLIVVSLHHAIIDEWSLEMLLGEWNDRTTPARGSMTDYVGWERAHEELAEAEERGRELAASLKARVGGAMEVQASPAVERRLDLGEALAERIGRCAVSLGTTRFVVLLAAYAAALARWRGEIDPLIATPFANRASDGMRGVIGCCIDLRLLRLQIGAGEPFERLARRAHDRVLREHDLGPVPIEAIAGVLRREADIPVDSCLRYAMTYRVGPMRSRTLGGVAARPIPVPVEQARFGLLAQFEQEDHTLGCTLEASANEHDEQDLREFAELLGRVLEEVTADPRGALLAEGAPAQAARTGMGVEVRVPVHERNGDEALEGECTRAWAQVLGVESPRATDHFFRSGGTSLLLIRLSGEIAKRTGRSLDVTAFLEEPVLGRIPGLLERSEEQGLVTFGGRGSGFVVVAFPGNLGPAAACLTLACELRRVAPTGYEFLGVDLTMLRKEGADFSRAMESLSELLTRHLLGRPFAMVGSSLGGIAAFDLASRLAHRGDRVERVWLLDSYVPEHPAIELARTGAAGALVLATSPLSMIRRLRDRLRDLKRMRSPEYLQPGTSGDGINEEGDTLAEAAAMRETAKRLLNGYAPAPIDADIVAFKSVHRNRPLGSYFRSGACGWARRLAGGSARSVLLNIHHADFMSGAGVQQVAALIGDDLGELLRRKDRRGDPSPRSAPREAGDSTGGGANDVL